MSYNKSKHFISEQDWSKAQLDHMFEVAGELKEKKKRGELTPWRDCKGHRARPFAHGTCNSVQELFLRHRQQVLKRNGRVVGHSDPLPAGRSLSSDAVNGVINGVRLR